MATIAKVPMVTRPPAASKQGVLPLKILQLKQDTSEVEIMEDNLKIVNQKLEASGAEAVSIIAVMGSYRTGKSFLLDLVLRYLRMRADKEAELHNESDEYVDLGTAEEHVDGFLDGLRAAPGQAHHSVGNNNVPATEDEASPAKDDDDFDFLAGFHAPDDQSWRYGEDMTATKPPWLLNGNTERIAEGSLGECQHDGFHYRSGMDKCTEGIWLWSQPFVFKDKDGRSIAVLLMDTQGAWDDSMTKSQSTTIFGLTSLLSSKLIYNIQNLIEEDKLDNLDYFTTFAQTVCNAEDMQGIDASFGHLQILIRDWANYVDGFTMEECKQQMMKHQSQHLSVEAAVDEDARAKCERLQKVFRTIKTFGLCHPGLKVTKPKYAGELSVVEDDFITLLDEFVKCFFTEDFPQPSAPLGCEILVSNFQSFVINIASAFRDNEACSAVGLREAFVKVECIAAKEQMVVKFKDAFQRIAPERRVLDPDVLMRQGIQLRNTLRDDFQSKLKPWRLPHSEELVDDLVETINQIIQVRKAANDNMIEGATLKVVASPVIGFGGYFLFTHHFILYPAIALGGWLHMKRRANSLHVETCHPAVFKELPKDWYKFAVYRWMDAQAVVVALQRFNPTDAYDSLARNAGQLGNLAGGALAAASANANADKKD